MYQNKERNQLKIYWVGGCECYDPEKKITKSYSENFSKNDSHTTVTSESNQKSSFQCLLWPPQAPPFYGKSRSKNG